MDPYRFGSYREWMEEEERVFLERDSYECTEHGFFEEETGSRCPICGEPMKEVA